MSNTELGSAVQVFVDNSNPDIDYRGNWINRTGLPTADKPLINAEDGPTPFYGTLNTFSGTGDGSFTYSFFGTAITAFFANSEATFSCLIDGVIQNVSHSLDDIGRRTCSGSGLLSFLTHNLTVNVELLGIDGTSLSFDGLFFSTVDAIPSDLDADVAYIIPNDAVTLNVAEPNSNALQAPGDTMLFQFDGVSMGVYSSFELTPPGVTQQPSTISYIIDQGIPISINIANPIMNNLSNVTSQLILQTPTLSPGPHSFQMTFIGPTEHGTKITPDRIITQSVNRNLTIVPDITMGLNQQTTEPRGGNQRISRSTVIAISVSLSAAALLILTCGLWFWYRSTQKRKLKGSIPSPNPTENPVVVPFHAPNVDHNEGFRIAEYTTREKTNKYRNVYGVPEQSPPTLVTGQDPTNAPFSDSPDTVSVLQVVERHDQPRRLRYLVHNDAGNAAIPESFLEDGDEVVSLPPRYNTVEGGNSYHR